MELALADVNDETGFSFWVPRSLFKLLGALVNATGQAIDFPRLELLFYVQPIRAAQARPLLVTRPTSEGRVSLPYPAEFYSRAWAQFILPEASSMPVLLEEDSAEESPSIVSCGEAAAQPAQWWDRYRSPPSRPAS